MIRGTFGRVTLLSPQAWMLSCIRLQALGRFRGERGLDAFEVELDNVRMAATVCRAA